jgi:hypothetical protein
VKRNVASQNIAAQLNSRTDGSPLTTTVSVAVTKDGGTSTASAGTLTHKANGHWNYAPTQGETDAAHVAFQFTHATGVNQVVQVYPTFPQTGDNYALLSGTQAEPGQGAPAATISPIDALRYLYKAWRNKKDSSATTLQFYADDGTTVDQKATVSESGGTVTKAEIVSGP